MVTKLTLEYHGGGFAGWARQPGLRTVQEEIERTLRRILGETGHDEQPLSLTVAGRTDRGVHAWGQVASYRHEAVNPVRLNTLLPEDIAVLSSQPATEFFDARRDALARTYCYRILNRRTRSAFHQRTALWWPTPLDFQVLCACAQALRGSHDFTAFTPTETEHVRFQREVLSAQWLMDGEVLEFWIEADTFMRHMNRVLVGTMLEVASGRRTIEEFERLLLGTHRSQAGSTAPAHGLALASVTYSDSSAGPSLTDQGSA